MSEIEKPKMGTYKRHILICVGPHFTEDGEAQELFESLSKKFKHRGPNVVD